MSVYSELLAIKAFRESKAELALGKQRALLADATARREAAQRQLDEFRAMAQARERTLYEDLCRRIVRLRNIEEVQQTVVILRGQEQEHAQRLDQAEARRASEADMMMQCERVYADASRMKQKFVELAQVYVEEQVRELERKEDAEMEEAAEVRRDRVDWEEREEAV